VAEFADGLVQRRGQRPAQPLVGTGLQLAGAPMPPDRGRAQGVEQHSLANPSEPGQHEGALRPTAGDALEYDVERAQLLIATGQLGRSLPGARRVRVPDRVHDPTVSVNLGTTLDFRSESSTSCNSRLREDDSAEPYPSGMTTADPALGP
jgi:hypothetical protein